MRSLLVAATLTGLVFVAAAASAADATPAAAGSPGAAAYRRYCGACHGLEGKGDGVVSGFMTPRPPDLTLLAKNNDGTFPMLRVISVIDGRDVIRAHGDRSMPVWGQEFTRARAQTSSTQAQVRGQVQEIADYLKSIQAK